MPEAGSGSPGDEEVTKTPSVRAPVGPPPTFQQTKYLRLKLTPRAPRPPMEPRRVLQIKQAPGADHPGRVSMEVTVDGLLSNVLGFLLRGSGNERRLASSRV